MTLEKGSSQATISRNIETEIKAGKSREQAAAIAYSVAREHATNSIEKAKMFDVRMQKNNAASSFEGLETFKQK